LNRSLLVKEEALAQVNVEVGQNRLKRLGDGVETKKLMASVDGHIRPHRKDRRARVGFDDDVKVIFVEKVEPQREERPRKAEVRRERAMTLQSEQSFLGVRGTPRRTRRR